MPKLHQILALSKTRLGEAKKRGDEIYHLIQKHQLANGGYGNYTPKRDDVDAPQPPERQRVQVNVEKALKAYARTQIPAWDIVFTKDQANTQAAGTVVVDGVVIWANVPVSTLIFLEKQLTDLHTVISKAPTLDPAENWRDELDSEDNHQTVPTETIKTKRESDWKVIVNPTDHFPADVREVHSDVAAGTWSRVKLSGALPAVRKEQLLARVTKWREAVKLAREEANTTDVAFIEKAEELFAKLLDK